eukprot:gene5615-10825_t
MGSFEILETREENEVKENTKQESKTLAESKTSCEEIEVELDAYGEYEGKRRRPFGDIGNNIILDEKCKRSCNKNVSSDLIQFVQKKHKEMSTSDAVCCRERCLVKMNINSMYEARKQFRELSGEKQRERILHFFSTMPTAGNWTFFIGTNKICRKAWQFIHGISNHRFYSLKQDFEIYVRVDGRSEKHGTKRETKKVAQAMNWFEKFIDESGDRAQDEEKMFLPTCYTKEDIYFSSIAQMHSDGFRDSTQIRNQFTKCGICTSIKELKKECSSLREKTSKVLSHLEQHSRPHAFKFQLSDDGSEVYMWYRHWSSEGDWVGDSDDKPFHVLSGYPNREPTLLRATYASQNPMEAIENGVRYCD